MRVSEARPPPDTPPSWGRLAPDFSTLRPRPVQFVHVALAASAAVHRQIFHLLQTMQMDLQLRVPQPVCSRTSRRLKRRPAFCCDHCSDQVE